VGMCRPKHASRLGQRFHDMVNDAVLVDIWWPVEADVHPVAANEADTKHDCRHTHLTPSLAECDRGRLGPGCRVGLRRAHPRQPAAWSAFALRLVRVNTMDFSHGGVS